MDRPGRRSVRAGGVVTLVDTETGEIVVLPLTVDEEHELAQHEGVIERGLQSFVEVGDALATIRDSRLYRAEHATFEDYCQQRWGLHWRRAYQLIDASATIAAVENLNNCSESPAPLPANEGQARALAPLRDKPEQMAEAMHAAAAEAAARNAKVTAQAIAEQTKKIVERETNKRTLARESAESFAEIAEKIGVPDDFDPAVDRRMTHEIMTLRNACENVTKLGHPDDFAARHAAHIARYMPHDAHILARQVELAEDAITWLDGFITAMGDN